MEKFSLEKAREEADRMTAKVETGQAKDYPEAEKQVDLEKVELAPVLVPVEQLIPDIKPKGSIELTHDESRGSGHNWQDASAVDLLRQLHTHMDYEIRERFFQDQIVIDLGAGNMYGYFAAVFGKAKGYIGVDKFEDLSQRYRDPDLVREFADKYYKGIGEHLIPVATEVEDMLTFLRRLPDNSVSIICSGIDHFVIENGHYMDEVRKEMERVLSPQGIVVVRGGISIGDSSAVERVAGWGNDFEVLAKKIPDKD